MNRVRNALAPVLLAILLAGCGFQLRGTSPAPEALAPLWVGCHGNVPAALCQSVKSHLAIGNLRLAENRQQAAYLLLLGNFRQQQRTSAITSQAEAAEYELRQTVSMILQTRAGIALLPETDVQAAQSYRFDATSVLAKRREQTELQDQLYGSLVRQIGYRLKPFDQQRIDSVLQDTRESEAGSP